ncbi:MAG TPA: C4-dicarboxylate TRAP transporter substrate-binding protein, partial [Magnetospirillaceae bacterium]|nr:C4-dicarboxylate TRAP transporter substrate-binding protein [Magnetospirillaceae bacterium]
MKVTRIIVLLALLTATVMAAVGQAAPARTFILRHNHVLTATDPYHIGFQRWAEAVARRSEGRLRIEVFPSAQLGVEEDILTQIQMGANIGQNTDSARLGMFVPGIAVMNGPYFAETLEEVQRIAETPSFRAWSRELEERHGFRILSFFWVQGFRHMITNVPIRTPADLRGLRIRTPPAPIWQESIRSLGATPVAMAFGEMYAGMQARAIDGVELSFTAGQRTRMNEVARFVNETQHILLINFQVVSARWFN